MGAPKFGVIYGVTSGEYSDYNVLALCADKITAEAWAESLREDNEGWHQDAQVSEFTLILTGAKPYNAVWYEKEMTLWDDGREEETKIRVHTKNAIEASFKLPIRPAVRKVRAPMYQNKGGRIEVIGPSKESVSKVSHEQLIMWRAANPKSMYWGEK